MSDNFLNKITQLILIRDYMSTVSGDTRIVPNSIRKGFDRTKVEIDTYITNMLLSDQMKIEIFTLKALEDETKLIEEMNAGIDTEKYVIKTT